MVRATANGLHIRDVLKLVYYGLFPRETTPITFPRYGFSLEVANDGDPHKSSSWTFRYKSGKLVELGGVPWLLSRGEGGKYGVVGLDSDIIAIPTDNPQDIEKCLKFGNSMIIAKRDGNFAEMPKYNHFSNPLRTMMERIDFRRLTAQKRVVDGQDGCLDADTLSGPAVRQPFTYRPGLVTALRAGLEEMLRNADPEDLNVENPWTVKDKN